MGPDRALAGELRACVCGKAKMNAKAGPLEVSASEARGDSQAKGPETGTLVHCPLAPCCQQPWAQRVIKSPARPAEHPFLCQSVQPGPPGPRRLLESSEQALPLPQPGLGSCATCPARQEVPPLHPCLQGPTAAQHRAGGSSELSHGSLQPVTALRCQR